MGEHRALYPLHPSAHKTEGRAPPPQDPAGVGLHLCLAGSSGLSPGSSPGCPSPRGEPAGRAAAPDGFGEWALPLGPSHQCFGRQPRARLLARHLMLEAGESQQPWAQARSTPPSRWPHPPFRGFRLPLCGAVSGLPCAQLTTHPHPGRGRCCGPGLPWRLTREGPCHALGRSQPRLSGGHLGTGQ